MLVSMRLPSSLYMMRHAVHWSPHAHQVLLAAPSVCNKLLTLVAKEALVASRLTQRSASAARGRRSSWPCLDRQLAPCLPASAQSLVHHLCTRC